MKHVFIIILIIAAVSIGIFLPYVHGDYDHFAVGLSHIFQFATFAALLLVPTGLIWLIFNIFNHRSKPTIKYAIWFRKVAVVIGVIIFLASALAAFASHNRFVAIIILTSVAFLLIFQRKLKTLFLVPDNFMPYYFLLIPLVVFSIRMTWLGKVKNNTTDFVIQGSELLIRDIEAYNTANGHYPVSLQSTIEDYKTYVSGIDRFHYEQNGDAYNLYFEQFSDIIGTQEIVMYNKLDEHEMTVHNQDLLRIPPESILRGYYKVVSLPQQHWKVFYFD